MPIHFFFYVFCDQALQSAQHNLDARNSLRSLLRTGTVPAAVNSRWHFILARLFLNRNQGGIVRKSVDSFDLDQEQKAS